MTNREARQAYLDDVPVLYRGAQYPRISAVIDRKDVRKNQRFIQLELEDPCGHSVTIASPGKVERAGRREQ